MHEKTVYILGAGFSKDAGAPLQSEILEDIFSISENGLIGINYRDMFFSFRDELKFLLSDCLYIDPTQYKNFSLEDIYSIIDRCITDNISLRNLDKIDLIEIREKINALIIMLMDFKLNSAFSKEYVQDFGNYLFKKRTENFIKDEESDPFTIISTNWDIVIENSLKELISLYHLNMSGENPLKVGLIDYCFYVHAFDEFEFGKKLRSGLYWRGKGLFNLKILKLHGSMNWLQCQRCQRVYITFFNKIALEHFISKPTCKYCGEEKGAELKSVLIMPTFLKDLNIFQLKLSWQIAGIELQEASKIVFMGYSFPMADFEFRQLLARSVRSDTKIEVVLHPNDEPLSFPNCQKLNDYLPETRYRNFFGKRNIQFFYKGVADYISNLISNDNA